LPFYFTQNRISTPSSVKFITKSQTAARSIAGVSIQATGVSTNTLTDKTGNDKTWTQRYRLRFKI